MKSVRQTRRDAQDLWRICHVKGASDEGRIRQVVELVLASGRTYTPALLTAFLRLVKLDRARRTSHVASAVPLDDGTRTAFEEGVSRRYGPAIETIFEVDPQLIGGTRVSVGSDVYDGSLRARFAALEARL